MSRISFGTEGWRGVIADDFTFAGVRAVSQAIARYLLESGDARGGVVVGHDARFLSERFAATAAAVLASHEIPVFLVEGAAPTPVIAFAVKAGGFAGGVVITASHNPAEYNGLKFKAAYGGAARIETTSAIEAEANRIIGAGEVREPAVFDDLWRRGTIRPLEPADAYLSHVLSLVDVRAISRAGLKVLVDLMHGAAAGYLDVALRRAGCEVHCRRAERNPGFGGVNPEPIPSNMARLLEETAAGFDLGMATDGDGDRLGLVDAGGEFVDPHRLFSLVLRHLVENRGLKGAVAKTVSVTDMVDRLAQMFGLRLFETPVGFKHICELMLTEDILIGGEESGGIGIRGHIPERDATVAALLVAELLAVSGKTLRAVVEELFSLLGRKYYYRRLDVPFPDSSREALRARLGGEEFRRLGGTRVERIETLDGFKYVLDDGRWLLIRPSGTEPLVRIYAEAEGEDAATALANEGKVILDSCRKGQEF